MSMTRQDFREIAEAVQEAKRRAEYDAAGALSTGEAAMDALARVTAELATACARQYKGSAGFKRQTFVSACDFPDA